MTIGTRIYGLGAVTLGIPGLVFGSFAVLGQSVPAGLPGYQILAYAAAALLVIAGLAASLPRTAAIGSLALAAFFALSVILLHLPHAAAEPMVWVLATFQQKIRLSGGPSPIARNHFIYASDWEGTPFTASYHRAKARGWTTSEIACGHDVMLDSPEALTSELIGVASGPGGPERLIVTATPIRP